MNNRKTMVLGAALLGGILLVSLYNVDLAIASSRKQGDIYQTNDAQMAADSLAYREECGSCHMVYPPQLLPEQSWRKMMNTLDDHFDENAELDNETRETIEQYLSQASKLSTHKMSKMQRNLGSPTPLRITELPYFIHEHDEIPSRFLVDNDKLNSMSQCSACHQDAEKGWFDEDDINIPGVGRWDD